MNKNAKDEDKIKLLSPKIDIIFKLLFGDKRNSEILIGFLKSVLNLNSEEYEKITIEDPHLKRESDNDKLGIVDVRITTKTGKQIQVELQVLDHPEMAERITYYNSKMLVSQLKSGQGFDNLQKTISILIADFDIISESPKYHNVFHIREADTGIKFTDIIEINTLELKKTPKNTDNTQKYNWLQFFNAEREEEFEMLATKDPIIKQAVVEIKRLSADEETQLLYEAREKARRDDDARIRFAMKTGMEKGIIEVAKTAFREGFDIESIKILTKLEMDLLKQLQEEVNADSN